MSISKTSILYSPVISAEMQSNEPLSEYEQIIAPYQIVRTGLLIVYFAILALASCGLLVFAGSLVFDFSIGNNTQAMFPILISFLGICLLGIFIGFLACLVAPMSNEKIKISLAMGCLVLAAVVPFFGDYMHERLHYIQNVSPSPLGSGGPISYCFAIFGIVFFMMFCKQIAINIGSYEFEGVSVLAMKWYSILVATAILYAVVIYGISAIAEKASASEMKLAGRVDLMVGLVLLFLVIISVVKQISMIRTGIENLTA